MIRNEKEYLKTIYDLLPSHGKNEKRFFSDFKESVLDFSDAKVAVSVEALTEHFGEPQEIVADYLKSQTSDYLILQLKRNHFCKKVFVLLTACALTALIIFSSFCYASYLGVMNSNIAGEITTIEEF